MIVHFELLDHVGYVEALRRQGRSIFRDLRFEHLIGHPLLGQQHPANQLLMIVRRRHVVQQFREGLADMSNVRIVGLEINSLLLLVEVADVHSRKVLR
jgi:hypothetical protein